MGINPEVTSCTTYFLIRPSEEKSNHGTFHGEECNRLFDGKCRVGSKSFKIGTYKFQILEGPTPIDSGFSYYSEAVPHPENSDSLIWLCDTMPVTHVMKIKKPFMLDGEREEVILYKYEPGCSESCGIGDYEYAVNSIINKAAINGCPWCCNLQGSGFPREE